MQVRGYLGIDLHLRKVCLYALNIPPTGDFGFIFLPASGDCVGSAHPTALLVEGEYVAITASILSDNVLSVHSEVLGLDLRLYPNKRFRFFDPKSNQILRSYEEAEQDRIQAEAIALQERQEKLQERLAKQIAEQGQQQAEAIADRERLAKQEAEAIATQERQEKLQERQQKEKLAAYLRSLGIDPDEI